MMNSEHTAPQHAHARVQERRPRGTVVLKHEPLSVFFGVKKETYQGRDSRILKRLDYWFYAAEHIFWSPSI